MSEFRKKNFEVVDGQEFLAFNYSVPIPEMMERTATVGEIHAWMRKRWGVVGPRAPCGSVGKVDNDSATLIDSRLKTTTGGLPKQWLIHTSKRYDKVSFMFYSSTGEYFVLKNGRQKE